MKSLRPSPLVSFLSLVSLALAGCTRAPSVGLFGAFFPDWLFCLASGVILTACVHGALAAGAHVAWLRPLALSYPMLAIGFAVLTWFVFFPR